MELSLTDVLLHESTPARSQRAFAELAQQRVGGIIVSGIAEFYQYRRLIVDLAEKSEASVTG